MLAVVVFPKLVQVELPHEAPVVAVPEVNGQHCGFQRLQVVHQDAFTVLAPAQNIGVLRCDVEPVVFASGVTRNAQD